MIKTFIMCLDRNLMIEGYFLYTQEYITLNDFRLSLKDEMSLNRIVFNIYGIKKHK